MAPRTHPGAICFQLENGQTFKTSQCTGEERGLVAALLLWPGTLVKQVGLALASRPYLFCRNPDVDEVRILGSGECLSGIESQTDRLGVYFQPGRTPSRRDSQRCIPVALWPRKSSHGMRAARIYRKTGNLRAVQLLLGYSKRESTVRYLGIEVEAALNMAGQIDL
jgi:hypothetical protein